MSFEPIRMTIPVLAVAKSRAKRNAAGFAYIPRKTKSFEAEIRWHWKRTLRATLPEVPTMLSVLIYLPCPQKPKGGFNVPITRPDLDNYAKAIMDGLNGFAWKDDAQIVDLFVGKRYCSLESYPTPTIEIGIEPTNGEGAFSNA